MRFESIQMLSIIIRNGKEAEDGSLPVRFFNLKPLFGECFNDCRVCQRSGVTDVVNLSCYNPLENPAHDLAGTGLWQCISKLDLLKK
ncbi:MAG: hypothetical protein ACFFAX_01640 [Promethearchaeota archaeon]